MSSNSKQTTLLRFLSAKRKDKQQKTTKSQPLVKSSEPEENLPLVEVDSEWNIIRINPKIAKSLFAKTVKTYYGLGKNYVAENLLHDEEKVEFLRRVYELFPYNYLAKSENGIPYYEYYSTAENIDVDIINHLQLVKIAEYHWEELDPHIAVRLITAHIRSSFGEFLKNKLSSRELKDVWIRLPKGRERVSLEFVKKFELGTLGYSIEDGEIWMALRRRSSASAVLLADFPPKVLEYVMIKLKKLAKEAVKQDYRKVRIYSETQPSSGTAAVIDVIIGHDNVIRFLEEHPKGAFHVKKRLEELGKSLDDVNYLLIGVYDNSISLKRALEDENCQYYFTEHNAYLVLTTEVQKELFGRIVDDWRGEIVEEYQEKLNEITTSGKLFSQVSGIKGITVNIRENLLVRTLKGEITVKDVKDIMRDESIFLNLLPISEKILNETKKHNLRLLIFYPKKFDERIKRSILLDQIERLRNGLLSNSFSSVEEVDLIPVSGDRSLDYYKTMLEAELDKVRDYTLATIIFPEQYNKRDLELREFYNWLKKKFYDETKPLVFQGARVESVFGMYNRYAVPNIVLQMAAKLGVYPYSLETSSGYDYIIGIDYTYWHERDAVSVGGGAVVISPSGLIEGIYPIAIPSKKESLDMKEILQEWFLKTVQNNPEIMKQGRVTVLISRDGMVPKYERNRIQEFLCEYSDELDMTIEAVEVRKRILTRIWSLDGPNAFYSPVKVGNYTYYMVNAHAGYPLRRKERKIYYSKPYLVGSLYRFQSGKAQPIHGSARRHLVESLIRLQKINYTTTKMDNVRLPLPIDITHKLINFIRDVNMRVKRVGIPNSLFMA